VGALVSIPRLADVSASAPALSRVEPSRMPTTIFGRDVELAALDSTLDSLDEHGSAIVIRGEAGIGKSFLVQATRERAETRGMHSIATAGLESEAKLPLAGLHTLLRPLFPRISRLPAPQRDALSVAFGLTAGERPEVFMIALATLTLLGDVAADRPLVVVVEDAQWLDPATADVLVFVARRLSSDRVVMLAALRSGYPTAFTAPDLTAIDLPRLDETAVRGFLRANWPQLTPGVRDRLITDADGSPLALAELPRALAPHHREGEAPLPPVLPMTAQLEDAFLERFAQMPEETQFALRLAALNDSDSLDEMLTATRLSGNELSADPLLPALDHGLVEVHGEILRFRHPLVRSAISQAATPTQRQHAHSALADALGAKDPHRGVWHRAAATSSPDETVAALLEGNARQSFDRGGLGSALAAFKRAAELSPDPAARGGRLVSAAELAVELGSAEEAARLLQTAGEMPLAQHDTARLAWLRETTSPDLGGGPEAIRSTVSRALDLARDGDADLALRILVLCAWNAFNLDTAGTSARLFLAALDELSPREDEPARLAVLAYVDPVTFGAQVVRVAPAHATGEVDIQATDELVNALGALGAQVRGEALFTRGVGYARSRGLFRPLSQFLMEGGYTSFLLGRWRSAEAAAEEALKLSQEAKMPPVWSGATNALKATLAGARGEHELAAQLADQASASALEINSRSLAFLVQTARGVNELSAGRYDRAYHELHRMFDPADPTHHSFWHAFAIGDLAEAGLAVGRGDEVRDAVRSVEPLAASESNWLRVGLQYADALLADDDEADDLYHAALEAELGSWPFYRARLQLAHGIRLRRNRHRLDSRPVLRLALETFDALGADPWAARTRQELRAAGEVGASRTTTRDTLTPQELQIAKLAADGLSNKEIGERLFLSPRTIGSHLYRIFPKLEISSRNQLTRALRTALAEQELGPEL
jgi:DNA-binding CsgD family transcriptional regulator